MALEDLKSQLTKDDKEQRKTEILKKSNVLSEKTSFYKPSFSTNTGVSSGYNVESITLSSAIIAPPDNASSNTAPVVVEPTPTPSPTATSTPTPTSTPIPSYSIGDAALGGIIAYILQSGDPGYVPGQQNGLVATVSDTSTGAFWGCEGTTITGADGILLGTGNQNTIDIVAQCGVAGIAAKLCSDLVQGGFSDWFLPSKDELNKLYLSKVAIGNFGGTYYWSSTEDNGSNAKIQDFGSGFQGAATKDSALYVRAVRSF